jgi:cell division protease FtsH
MAANFIPISSLPTNLTPEEAVEAVCRDDLDWIRDKLVLGLSVLVECDKQLTFYLYRALRSRVKSRGDRQLRLLAGHADASGGQQAAMSTLMQRMIRQLQEAIFSGETDNILVLPHLDILATTTQSGLSAETREAAALLYENPDAVFLAFRDPSFELPKVIENVFPARRSLVGIPRDRLPAVVTRREARKFGVDEFNPFVLYKYVSGLNPVRFRQILGHFADRLDFDPAHPRSAEEIYREIRQMTVVGDLEMPQVDLDSDIGGYEDVKKRIKSDILDLLRDKDRSRDPEFIRSIEEIIPKGIIFHGPPGTGKTFFAKAIATALDATISIVSGPELKSKWVGESEENLRRVFSQARKSAPSIIVFDELDSFASARGTYAGSSGVEHSMVNQLLTEMDGFRKEELVFVVGTTNFMEALDPALLRPGRFELEIEIPYPDAKDRRAILEIYFKKFNLDVDEKLLDHIVEKTAGFVDERQHARFSGDHLYAIARALKREETRRNDGQLKVTVEDANKAIGSRKKAPVKLTPEEEATVAVHEAGHAIIAYVLPRCPTIEKITIATGEEETLGYVMQAARKKKYVTTREELLDDLCVLLGGRAAEKLLIGDVSAGAYNDIQRATEIARMMVEELGMSDALGLRSFANIGEGRSMAAIIGGGERRRISEDAARLVDQEIGRLLADQATRADKTLEDYRPQLDKLRDILLEKKTVGLDELKELFEGKNFKGDAPIAGESEKAES